MFRIGSRRPARCHGTVVRAVVLAACSTLGLAGCDGDDPRAVPAYADEDAPGSVAAEQARLDSIAEWKARFGDRVPQPDSIRGLYVNGWAAGSRSRMAALMRIAEETEINTFVIDIKESDTYLTYSSTGIVLAAEIGADQRPASLWLPALIDSLQTRGVYPVARIVVFKDHMLAEKRPDLAIQHTNGGIWRDQHDRAWVDPYNRTVWDYNIEIAREALEMGFAEIQWDYVRFPDVVESRRQTMVFPAARGESRAEAIRDFIDYSREQLAEYRVPITADVFGLATHMEGDVGIGQQWEKLIEAADALLPMVYPSHYYAGFYGFSHPNAHPYEVVRISMQEAIERTDHVREQGVRVGEIRPYLQAMSATWIDQITYGPEHLRNQIQATYDSGLKSWVLWNPSSRYDVFLPALRGADGSPSPLERGGWQPVSWEVPRHRLSRVILQRDAVAEAVLVTDSARRSATGM